jgi:thioredoxin reductase (NADPH)
MNNHHKLIIIGSGPAGLTAAIYAARANLNPLVIKGPNPGGQLMGTSFIENWPGTMSIRGPQLMQNMEEHAAHLGTQFLDDTISSTDFSQKPFSMITKTGQTHTANAVIIATGATPKRLGCPGEDHYWGKGVTTCAVCDGAFYKDMPVVIVGGGDTAMEDASFMLNFTDKITIIHIGQALSASHAMQEKIIDNPAITIIYNSTVTAIEGDGQTVSRVTITHQKNQQTSSLDTKAVFVAIGLNPNVQPFKDQIAINHMGFIAVMNNTHTSIPGVFCAGDVFDYRYRQAITSAGSGCMAALDAEKYLKSGKNT